MKRLRALMVRLAGLFGGVRREREVAADRYLRLRVPRPVGHGTVPYLRRP